MESFELIFTRECSIEETAYIKTLLPQDGTVRLVANPRNGMATGVRMKDHTQQKQADITDWAMGCQLIPTYI